MSAIFMGVKALLGVIWLAFVAAIFGGFGWGLYLILSTGGGQ